MDTEKCGARENPAVYVTVSVVRRVCPPRRCIINTEPGKSVAFPLEYLPNSGILPDFASHQFIHQMKIQPLKNGSTYAIPDALAGSRTTEQALTAVLELATKTGEQYVIQLGRKETINRPLCKLMCSASKVSSAVRLRSSQQTV